MPLVIVKSKYVKSNSHFANYLMYAGNKIEAQTLNFRDGSVISLDNETAVNTLTGEVLDNVAAITLKMQDGKEKMLTTDEYMHLVREETKEVKEETLTGDDGAEVFKSKEWLKYITYRPSSTGLFNQFGAISVDDAVHQAEQYQDSIKWSHIISLERSDADRTGYNNAETWRILLADKLPDICKAYNISLENVVVNAAYHDKDHHPHIHLFMYSKDNREGFIQGGVDGMKKASEILKSKVTNEIFHDDLEPFKIAKNELMQEMNKRMKQLCYEVGRNQTPDKETVRMLCDISAHLKNHQGKMVYGYLAPETKQLVNKLLFHVVHKDSNIREIYAQLLDNQKRFIECYNDEPEKIEERLQSYKDTLFNPKKGDNTELQNVIVRYADKINAPLKPQYEYVERDFTSVIISQINTAFEVGEITESEYNYLWDVTNRLNISMNKELEKSFSPFDNTDTMTNKVISEFESSVNTALDNRIVLDERSEVEIAFSGEDEKIKKKLSEIEGNSLTEKLHNISQQHKEKEDTQTIFATVLSGTREITYHLKYGGFREIQREVIGMEESIYQIEDYAENVKFHEDGNKDFKALYKDIRQLFSDDKAIRTSIAELNEYIHENNIEKPSYENLDDETKKDVDKIGRLLKYDYKIKGFEDGIIGNAVLKFSKESLIPETVKLVYDSQNDIIKAMQTQLFESIKAQIFESTQMQAEIYSLYNDIGKNSFYGQLDDGIQERINALVKGFSENTDLMQKLITSRDEIIENMPFFERQKKLVSKYISDTFFNPRKYDFQKLHNTVTYAVKQSPKLMYQKLINALPDERKAVTKDFLKSLKNKLINDTGFEKKIEEIYKMKLSEDKEKKEDKPYSQELHDKCSEVFSKIKAENKDLQQSYDELTKAYMSSVEKENGCPLSDEEANEQFHQRFKGNYNHVIMNIYEQLPQIKYNSLMSEINDEHKEFNKVLCDSLKHGICNNKEISNDMQQLFSQIQTEHIDKEKPFYFADASENLQIQVNEMLYKLYQDNPDITAAYEKMAQAYIDKATEKGYSMDVFTEFGKRFWTPQDFDNSASQSCIMGMAESLQQTFHNHFIKENPYIDELKSAVSNAYEKNFSKLIDKDGYYPYYKLTDEDKIRVCEAVRHCLNAPTVKPIYDKFLSEQQRLYSTNFSDEQQIKKLMEYTQKAIEKPSEFDDSSVQNSAINPQKEYTAQNKAYIAGRMLSQLAQKLVQLAEQQNQPQYQNTSHKNNVSRLNRGSCLLHKPKQKKQTYSNTIEF